MSSSDDLIGRVIGGYKLVEPIGSGAMATVFKAYQPNLERWVAVKVLYYKEKSALLRFEREAKAIAILRHRNILIVYEYGQEGQWPYIVMEYVAGGTLSSHLTGQPMDPAHVINLVLPVAEALSYAHSKNIIHRDVKPSNILLPQPDWPLLADFGLAKFATGHLEVVTRTGTSLGTPAYVSPEQARGADIDPRSDMYSLGVILFELVTGRLPFNYSNATKMLLAHISEPIPSPRALNPACPPALEQVILTATNKDANQRYPDMATMIVALRQASGGATPSTGPTLQPGLQTAPMPPIKKPTGADPTVVASMVQGQARLLLVEKNVTLQVLAKDEVIIGRSQRSGAVDIDLGPYGAAQMGISRHHARLIRRGKSWLVDDLNSLNGTFVNEVKVQPGQPVALKNGDVVRCSHLVMVFLA